MPQMLSTWGIPAFILSKNSVCKCHMKRELVEILGIDRRWSIRGIFLDLRFLPKQLVIGWNFSVKRITFTMSQELGFGYLSRSFVIHPLAKRSKLSVN